MRKHAEHVQLVKTVIERETDPLRYSEIKKKTRLYDMALTRAISDLVDKGQVERIIIQLNNGREVPGYSKPTLTNDLSERIRYFLRTSEVLQGAFVQLVLSKNVHEMVKEYLPPHIETTGRGWDSFLEFRERFGNENQTKERDTEINRLEKVGLLLHKASTELTSLIIDKLERKKVQALGKRQKELYKLYAENASYHSFLEERNRGSGEYESYPTLDVALSQEDSHLGETLSKLISRAEGKSTEEKLKNLFSDFRKLRKDTHTELAGALHLTKLVRVPLADSEKSFFKRLDRASKIARKIQDEVQDELEENSEDCMLIVSLRPLEQLGLRERIVSTIRGLDKERLNELAIMHLSNMSDAGIARVLEFLKLWPKEGPASNNYERICRIIIWGELLRRQNEFNHKARKKLEEYREFFDSLSNEKVVVAKGEDRDISSSELLSKLERRELKAASEFRDPNKPSGVPLSNHLDLNKKAG